jgi:hypothetical protein
MPNCEWCEKKLHGKQTRFCSTVCKSNEAVDRWRRETKIKAVALLGGCCSNCGYNKNYAALTFHHRAGRKAFRIGCGKPMKWEKVLAELEKCVLLCLNCHAEEHYPEKVIMAS